MNNWKKKRSVMRRYNLTAAMYESRYQEEQEVKYGAALEKLDLRHISVALDAGCGTGIFFRKVACMAEAIVGVDISRNLLRLALKRAKEYGNVSLVLADADNLPFQENVFDVVFVFTVLQNMPEPIETLRHLQFSAKTDAYFVVTGLKATISVNDFEIILREGGLRIVTLQDKEAVKCYVATAVRN